MLRKTRIKNGTSSLKDKGTKVKNAKENNMCAAAKQRTPLTKFPLRVEAFLSYRAKKTSPNKENIRAASIK